MCMHVLACQMFNADFQEQVSKSEDAVTLYQSQRQVLLDSASQDKAASVAYRSLSDCASQDAAVS